MNGWRPQQPRVTVVSAVFNPFPFNKVGMVNGHVETISPDAAELPDTRERDRKDTREHVMPPAGCRALVALDAPYLERDGKRFRVSAGMLVSAEVNLGSRTVMEYLLSPVQKVTHEAGREMQSFVVVSAQDE